MSSTSLRITMHPPKPLVWWYRNRELIDMAPPYQRRGRLWSPTDKGYLIDSLINGFDVPKLYLADFQFGDSSLNLGRLPYAIIDGKQRLEAVFDFFENTLLLNEDFQWRQQPELKLGGLSLRDLRAAYPQVADLFETETLDIMSVITNDEADINELFVRLNRSKPLTGAEIRNAILGPVPDIIRLVARHEFFASNIRFDVKRAADYNAAAKIVLFEYNGKLSGTKKTDLDNFATGIDVNREKLELSGRRALENLDEMQEVFLPKDPLLSSAGNVPLYYCLVREASPTVRNRLREFITAFEQSRRSHRGLQRADARVSHAVFARFDAFNRSTNDIGSYVGRFEILRDSFEEWLKTGQTPLGVFA
jgi:hypothetical protein